MRLFLITLLEHMDLNPGPSVPQEAENLASINKQKLTLLQEESARLTLETEPYISQIGKQLLEFRQLRAQYLDLAKIFTEQWRVRSIVISQNPPQREPDS